MNAKPIVRWTIGPLACKYDDAILRRSIGNFISLYGDIFDYFLCLNGRDSFDRLDPRVTLVKQTALANCPEPNGCTWKLYPPRIRIESHEIFMDHDIVLVDRIEKIDRFLESSDAFIYTQAASDLGNYGRFSDRVREGFRLNSGLFGLPPGRSLDLVGVGDWKEYFDDQGFVASIFCREKNLIKVDLEEIWICDSDLLPKTAKGYHFVRNGRERSWLDFLRSSTI